MYRLVVISFYFYGNNDIAPSVWTSTFPAIRLLVSQSRSRRRDRRVSQSSGVSEAIRCLRLITRPTSRQVNFTVFRCL